MISEDGNQTMTFGILRHPTHNRRRVISVKIVTLRRLPKLPERKTETDEHSFFQQ